MSIFAASILEIIKKLTKIKIVHKKLLGMANWKKTTIILKDGRVVEAQAPEIISASRSTDIPAFYADWFFHRLQAGYSVWINPFNGVKSYVSYQNTRFIVFWSKNPRPLLLHLPILKERNIGCYVQYTLNDYEAENLETGVPSLEERIETFKLLSKKMGKDAVIWRFDPMLLTDKITIETLLRKVEYIGTQLHDYTEKLVFSYADIASYRKVKSNLDKNDIQYSEWDEKQMEEFAYKLSDLNKRKGWNLKLATCGEKINTEKYGILHNRCIDGDLIISLAWQDRKLMNFLKVKIEDIPTPSLFGDCNIPSNAILLPNNHYFLSSHQKDSGQRKFCECMVAKDIGEYNTCPHLCEYCYANANKQVALNNWEMHKLNSSSETITGK